MKRYLSEIKSIMYLRAALVVKLISVDGDNSRTRPNSVEEYMARYPKDVQDILKKIRQVIKEAAPEAEETISYGMPSYKLNGPLVYFAAFKNHIGFYAIPSGISAFENQLSPYKRGKGSVQFQIKEPIPYDLIREIVKFRAKENMELKLGDID